jgi:hypothetical protein
LSQPWQRRADEAFERYRETMPMKEIVEKLLDTTVGQLSSAGRLSGLSTVDDGVRDKPIFGVAKEFHLIGEEQGYNIVRRGPEIYAIDQSLGPLDLATEIESLITRHSPERIIAVTSEIDARLQVQAVRLGQLLEAAWNAILSVHHRFGAKDSFRVVLAALRKWRRAVNDAKGEVE